MGVTLFLELINSYCMIGACESCPSSTTTMKMGIERVLKEKFGDSVKDIRQVNEEQVNETTVEVCISHIICNMKSTGFSS